MKSGFKQLFSELITFGTPRAVAINLFSILLILFIIPTKYLIYSPVKCVFKNFLLPIIFNGHCPAAGIFSGCNCPACGLTRAMSYFLHGDLSTALSYNILVIPVFCVMMFLIVLNLYRFIKSKYDLN